jgi:hypothetical protein
MRSVLERSLLDRRTATTSHRVADPEAMMAVILRECIVLLVGVTVAFAAALFGNAGRDFAALVAAILFPIGFCLARAAMVKYPRGELSLLRRGALQLATGTAIVSLFLFEVGVAMFAGAADIPRGAWGVVVGFGVGYVFLFCIAHRLGLSPDHCGAG